MGEDFGFDFSGDPSLSTSVGVPADTTQAAVLPGDWADAQQMQPWVVAPQGAQQNPWWQNIAMYGITKAIDNAFPGSPTGIMGNMYPGSAAGINGKTYSARPIGAGGGVVSARVTSPLGNLQGKASPLLLLAGLAVLLVLVK